MIDLNKISKKEERYGCGEGQRLWPPFDTKPKTSEEQRDSYQRIQTFSAVAIGTLAFCVSVYQTCIISDTEKNTLRPYVSVTARTVTLFQPGKPPAVLLGAINSGVTPARNSVLQYAFAIAPDNPEHNYILPEVDVITMRQRITIPHASDEKWTPFRLFGKKPISQQQFFDVTNGDHVLVIKGTLSYEDVFRKVRRVSFCYAYSWQMMLAYAKVVNETKDLGGESPSQLCLVGNDEE